MSLSSVRSLSTSFHSEYKEGRKLCQASLRATFSRKIWDCSQVYVCALVQVFWWTNPPPPPSNVLPTNPPATQPAADRCARPPSRLQCRESDNIRSILFPVTHSPRPTGKWKRLLEAVNGDAEGELGHSGHYCVGVGVCAWVGVCVCVCPAHLHAQQGAQGGQVALKMRLN